MITDNYIKMCEADEDLKWDDKSWKPKYGDYRPTQEELQDMIFPEDWIPRECLVIMRKFQYFYEQNCDAFNSFEEVWFAFVKKEKYHKIWNGEEWKNYEEAN